MRIDPIGNVGLKNYRQQFLADIYHCERKVKWVIMSFKLQCWTTFNCKKKLLIKNFPKRKKKFICSSFELASQQRMKLFLTLKTWSNTTSYSSHCRICRLTPYNEAKKKKKCKENILYNVLAIKKDILNLNSNFQMSSSSLPYI